MTRRHILCRALAALALMAGAAGCGSSTNFEVSGTVTWNGKPVPKGFITFVPDTEKGNSGPGGGAEIIDGKYRTPRGKGVVGGAYKVQIVGYDGVAYKEKGEDVVSGKSLFNMYETTAEFPKESTTKDFTVPEKVEPPKKKAQPGDDRDGN